MEEQRDTRASRGLARSLVAAVFSGAGTVIGALLGLMVGFIEDGLLRGTLVGAVTGALVSVDLADSLLRIWTCGGCPIDARIERTRLMLRSLAAGRLLRGSSVFPTISDALDSQMEALFQHDAGSGGDLFEPSSGPAGQRANVGSLPATTLTQETAAAGPHTTCPICLHEFQAGESARRLPACRHVFHLACIDSWLLWKAQCPMCRHAVY